jgi:hypothetical protein
MCFKVNTVANSSIVVGNRSAVDLPNNPGRGIWSFGSDQYEVQAPLMSTEQIVELCERIKEDFDYHVRWLYSPMISLEEESEELPESDSLPVDPTDSPLV